jgi:hypothetical protein
VETAPARSVPRSLSADSAIATGNTVKVRGIDDPQTATLRLLVDTATRRVVAGASARGRTAKEMLAEQALGKVVPQPKYILTETGIG